MLGWSDRGERMPFMGLMSHLCELLPISQNRGKIKVLSPSTSSNHFSECTVHEENSWMWWSFGLFFFKQNLDSFLHGLETVPLSKQLKQTLFPSKWYLNPFLSRYLFLNRNKGTLSKKQFFYTDCVLLFASPCALREHEEMGGEEQCLEFMLKWLINCPQ